MLEKGSDRDMDNSIADAAIANVAVEMATLPRFEDVA
jgi:hypothetical protein